MKNASDSARTIDFHLFYCIFIGLLLSVYLLAALTFSSLSLASAVLLAGLIRLNGSFFISR